MSVREIARVIVKPGEASEFLEGMVGGRKALLAADGCNGVEVLQGIEQPDECLVLVTWDSVAAHQAFQSSPEFAAFVGAIGAHIAEAPPATHYEVR